MRILSRTAAVFLTLTPIVAGAEELGDPQQGLAFAIRYCAECHAVEASDELSPVLDAPKFAIVANMPGMTARALVVWLQTSHPTMPDLIIDPKDRDNVIAYIMSLRKKGE